MDLASRVAARYKGKKVLDTGTVVYEYSPRQVARRNNEKARRLEALRKNATRLRAQVKKDLKSGDPERVLTALAVGLMDHTAERVGNEESAQEGHVGVTGWSKSHVSFGKGKATISYVGKSGVKQKKSVTDKALVSALRDAYEACEEDIFCHDTGTVDAKKVNSYLKSFDITAKDLRGLHANTVMQQKLKAIRKGELPIDPKERKAQLKAEFKKALEETASAVGHEASTLRSQYLVPGLEDEYMKGRVMDKMVKAAASERVAHRYIQSRKVEVNEAFVESLRKDVLTLTKNAPRIKSEEDYEKFRQGIVNWRKFFDAVIYKRWLNALPRDIDHRLKYHLEKVRKVAWDLYIDMEVISIDWWDQRKLRLWAQRIQKKARALWKLLRDVIGEYNRFFRNQGQGDELQTEVESQERYSIAGFNIVVKGFSEDFSTNHAMMSGVQEALKAYRQRASKVMPLLLKMQRPMILDFNQGLDKGGSYFSYDRGVIMINPAITLGQMNVKRGIKTLAHEMGHHVWAAYLPSSAKETWETTIYGNYGPLDLEELLKKWPERLKWMTDFTDYMAPKDSILALQVETAYYQNKELDNREAFVDLLKSGTKKLNVPKTPITGYASKNPEEAFCETLGLLVAYGPRAVHEKVRYWLETVFPGQVKTASRVAQRYQRKANEAYLQYTG